MGSTGTMWMVDRARGVLSSAASGPFDSLRSLRADPFDSLRSVRVNRDRWQRGPRAVDCLLEIVPIHLDADEIHAQFRARDGGGPETEERVGDEPGALKSMETQAHLRELWREGRRMRPVLLAALNRLVRDEPRVTAAADTRCGRSPSPDVRLVLVAHADRLSIDRCVSRRGEVE